MDNSTKEALAINYLERPLLKTEIIQPYINRGDKEPSWDGHLTVYKSDQFSVENFLLRIPVQVKYRSVEKFHNKISILKKDVINFETEGKIIYFVAQSIDNAIKMYYKPMLLYDLRKFIQDCGEHDSMSVDFEEFPLENVTNVKQIINKFIENSFKQKETIPGILSLEEYTNADIDKSVTFDLRLPLNFTKTDIINAVKEQTPYLYHHANDLNLDFPIDKFDNFVNFMVGESFNCLVNVNGETLFDKINNVEMLSGDKYSQLGKHIKIRLQNNKFKCSFDIKGTLKERIATLKFIVGLMNKLPIYFNNIRLPELDIQEDANEFNNLLKYYEDISLLIDKLGIIKNINLDKLSKQQLDILYWFSQSELYNKETPLTVKDKGIYFIRFDDVKILCYAVPTSPSSSIIYNIFNENKIRFGFEINKEFIPSNSYLILGNEDDAFSKIDNINYDLLVKSVKDENDFTNSEEFYVKLLLNILKFYDSTKNKKILECAQTISKELNKKINSDLHFLNFCQTKKRLQNLNKQEIKRLLEIKNSTTDNEIKCACCIILDSKEEFEYYYDLLNEEERNRLNLYPIINLIK